MIENIILAAIKEHLRQTDLLPKEYNEKGIKHCMYSFEKTFTIHCSEYDIKEKYEYVLESLEISVREWANSVTVEIQDVNEKFYNAITGELEQLPPFPEIEVKKILTEMFS